MTNTATPASIERKGARHFFAKNNKQGYSSAD
jgi:hypothetical protein